MEVLPWGGAREKGLAGPSWASSSLEGEVEREERELWLSHNSF